MPPTSFVVPLFDPPVGRCSWVDCHSDVARGQFVGYSEVAAVDSSPKLIGQMTGTVLLSSAGQLTAVVAVLEPPSTLLWVAGLC